MKHEFGPNQAKVDAFLERLETVDQGQALFLAGLGGDDPARETARKALTDAARRGGRERARQLKAAQEEVIRWVNTWFSGGFQIAGYGRDITPAQAVVAASPVVLDAIGALVLSDLLETDDHDALIGPWLELVEGDG